MAAILLSKHRILLRRWIIFDLASICWFFKTPTHFFGNLQETDTPLEFDDSRILDSPVLDETFYESDEFRMWEMKVWRWDGEG